jgi:LTXXQ motif family protein
MPRSKLMTYKMQQVRAFALVFGLAPLASASWALAQPSPETQQIAPPASEATRTDPDRRGGGLDSTMDRRRGMGEDERRFGGRFEPDDDGDRHRFNRSGRDRDDGRYRGQWRGREFDREENDWIRPPTMGDDRMIVSDAWLTRICSPDGDRIATFMLERLERIAQPTEAQRAAFASLKNATARASEMARAACPTEQPITPPGRLAAAEKRLEALLRAVRTVRPAMDSFYGSLTDEQKARLLIGQARWSWGGRHERREAGGQGDPGYDRLFDEDRSERRDLGAGRWRGEEDYRPRRGWRDGRYGEDSPRRYNDRDPWQDGRR